MPLLCACDLVILSREFLERQMHQHGPAEAEAEAEAEGAAEVAAGAAPSLVSHEAVVGLRALRRRVATCSTNPDTPRRPCAQTCTQPPSHHHLTPVPAPDY